MPHQASPLHVAKAEFFRTLGHPARVRILELLRDGERSVGALQAESDLDSGGTSQQLAALRRIGVVEGRREGTSVFYSVTDDAVFDLLEDARQILDRVVRARLAETGGRMNGALCVAGALLLLAGSLLPAATPLVRAGLLIQALGATLLGIAGGSVLWSGDPTGAGFSGGLEPAFGVDRLSGVFLLMLGIVSGARAGVRCRLPGRLRARSRAVAALTGRVRADAGRAAVRARRASRSWSPGS